MPNIIELLNNSIYRGEIQILKDIFWQIKNKEHWALIGPNGSGKTTLLKIISGFLWPSSGKVKVLGEEFGKTDLRQLRKKIGWVASYLLQRIPITEKSIDVVISGKYSSFGVYQKITESDRKKATELLDFLECSYVKDRKFNIISQGERQKVLIARALMANPLILILDEPCTGLDMKARKNLLESVSKICQEGKITVIYVTHHFEEIIPEISKVLMIKEGKVFKQGNKEYVLRKENIEEMFE